MTLGPQSGLSLIELLVAGGLLAILAGIAIPQFQSQTYDLWEAHTVLVADLRQARAYALTRGDHFMLDVTSATTYELRRLRDDDNDKVWEPDPQPLRARTLPGAVTFTAGAPSQFEFNTRGLMVVPDNADALVLVDSHTGFDRTVTVWPSGQVMPL